MKHEEHYMQIFQIVGIPKPQGRPRFARMGNFVKAYDPRDSKNYKDNVAAQLMQQKPTYIDSDAIALGLVFLLPRPKSLKKTIVWHTKKPDIDNLIKAVMDAAKGILWRDDSQVVRLRAAKQYTVEQPGIEIIIESTKCQ